jgi:molybdopterin-guanine dinucleotide biosynthesis protein MobB
LKIVLFAGYSNSGKTTAMAGIIKALAKEGKRVGTIKHVGHPTLDIDARGKDTWTHLTSGASRVVGVSSQQMAVFSRRDDSKVDIDVLLADMKREGMDYVLIEGFFNDLSNRGDVATVICAKTKKEASDLLRVHRRPAFICGRLTARTASPALDGVRVLRLPEDTGAALKLIG